MRFFWGLLLVLGLLSSGLSSATGIDDLHSKVAADLKHYYEDSYQQPFIVTEETPRTKPKPTPWETPLKQLSVADAKTGPQAAVYLCELLTQALKDEQSGTAPWRATPCKD